MTPKPVRPCHWGDAGDRVSGVGGVTRLRVARERALPLSGGVSVPPPVTYGRTNEHPRNWTPLYFRRQTHITLRVSLFVSLSLIIYG